MQKLKLRKKCKRMSGGLYCRTSINPLQSKFLIDEDKICKSIIKQTGRISLEMISIRKWYLLKRDISIVRFTSLPFT